MFYGIKKQGFWEEYNQKKNFSTWRQHKLTQNTHVATFKKLEISAARYHTPFPPLRVAQSQKTKCNMV